MAMASCHNQSIVVTGLPRSGTSMLMQMLDAGGLPTLTDGIRQADTDNPKGYYEYEPVKRIKTDKAWLDLARGKAVKMVHLLLYDLPLDRPYRVLLIKRSIQEVLASQSAMLRRLHKTGATLSPERLAQTYSLQIDKITRWLSDQPCFDMLTVHHHEVLATPLAQAKRINEHLNDELDISAMAAVIDPRLYRQRNRE